MDKGKVRTTEKKYLSIVLVPHSSSHVKVLRFNAFYTKLIVSSLLITAVFICGGFYISRMIQENKSLRQNLNELYSTNTEQRQLIEEKSGEIDKLKKDSASFSEIVNDKIEQFTEQYNKITDDYISNQKTKSSRSGERTETSFTNDMGVLKDTLDSLSSVYSRTGLPVADLSAAEAKISSFMETVPTLWPAFGHITDEFGYRKDPFTRRTKYHEGIDIGSDYGNSIKAAAGGTVTFAQYTRGTGRTVIINHGRGISTVYGHASKILVKEGQKVSKGDVIARVGSSGRSTGPHLHFQVMLYGTPVNPLPYLDVK
ncbi:MAG TPA: peptidoglycan DD-metalloendopeptidase family protein [Clostridia bacterium]|nr:peptidoglycan DD-metalloendopeptidase family protein [Clostridia bacterium]